MRAQSSAKVTERTVVAFENPMYDDPAQGSTSAVYDQQEEVRKAEVTLKTFVYLGDGSTLPLPPT